MSYIYKQKILNLDLYETPLTTSTNDDLVRMYDNNNIILCAQEQKNGKGRRGNIWQSNRGNLYFSYSQRFAIKDLSKMVCIIGLSLAQTIKNISPQSNVNIKWPNDVFLEQKKVSGILIENIRDDIWCIGIGVNIECFPSLDDASYQATSLKENNINIDRIEFLKEYINVFFHKLNEYKNQGFTQIKEDWLSLALNYQKNITIKIENTLKIGVFLTLDDDGYLVLENNGIKERIIAGDLFI